MANLTGVGKAWLGVGTPVFRLGRLYSSVVGVWLARPAWVPLQQLDVVRIGHFRGFADYWEIPASDANNVVYTGTHDNNTSQGWWLEASDAERQHVRDCLGLTPQDELEIHWQLITTACASVADTAIHPMQDVLGLDGSSRMNLPGVRQGCWEWRFNWDQVKAAQAQRLVRLGNRLGNLYRR